jgi:trehalose 6-phosphate synthase/phosphatase
MMLPAKLKEEHPNMKVGWFLHTPFPSSEIYRMLPVREELLLSVLSADLVGFHTYDYARHFVSACSRILGFEGTPEGVEDNGNFTRVAAFPIGRVEERSRSCPGSTCDAHTHRAVRRLTIRFDALTTPRSELYM